ncbi:MAG: hypothetical protein ACYCS7_14490 [Acidimicrobiales bacterium]
MLYQGPTVVLEGGEEASGLATMLAKLLEDNVRDFPWRARVARGTRGDVVLTASDRGLSVTLSFRGHDIVVRDGVAVDAASLSGSWEDMAKLCSGQASPAAALARGRVRVRPGARFHVVPAASFVLSVPASFYDDDPRQRRRLLVGGGTVTAATLGAVAACRWRGARRRHRQPGRRERGTCVTRHEWPWTPIPNIDR